MTETVLIHIDRKTHRINVDSEDKELILKAAQLLDKYARSIPSQDSYIRILQAALYYAMETERLKTREAEASQMIGDLITNCETPLAG